MPLENASTIGELDNRYPLGGDSTSRGDDHLRLIKTVMKNQFPGADGNGFNAPITLTEEFLNGLPAAIEKIKSDADKRYPIGFILLLVVALDPNGTWPGVWQLVTGDASLSIGNGSSNVGVISGNNTPVVPVPGHAHGASFSGYALPGHAHSIHMGRGGDGGQGSDGGVPYVTMGEGAWTGTNAISAGVPSGAVSIAQTGATNQTMDVRGARYSVNVWRRIS